MKLRRRHLLQRVRSRRGSLGVHQRVLQRLIRGAEIVGESAHFLHLQREVCVETVQLEDVIFRCRAGASQHFGRRTDEADDEEEEHRVRNIFEYSRQERQLVPLMAKEPLMRYG